MMFFRRLLTVAFSSVFPGESKAAPSPAHRAIAAAFRAWAEARSLRVVDAEPHSHHSFRVVGRLAGRDVVVDPGIDGRVPGWVQVTVAVSIPEAKPLLVTRTTPITDAPIFHVRALFDDAELGPELRAITLSPRQLRLRLAPGASPDLVEHAVRRIGETLRVLYQTPEPRTDRTSGSQPRHSCITTVPYPT